MVCIYSFLFFSQCKRFKNKEKIKKEDSKSYREEKKKCQLL